MKPRKVFLLVLLLIGVAFVVLYYLRKPPEQAVVEPASVETEQANEANRTPAAPATRQKSQATAPPAVASEPTPESDPAGWIENRVKQQMAELERGKDEWRTPIEFYGMVVDENTNAVAGAQADIDCNDLSPTGTSFYHTQSDANGLFSIQGITGKLLGVKVNKDGYYSYQPHGLNFYYAGQNQNFIPDAANPVIFRLKKKGIAEPLVVFEKNFQISISGKPLEIDLSTGKAVSPGQGNAIMEFVKQPPEKPGDRHYDWTFRVTVPNGGLLLSTHEFDFLAPEKGYELSALVEMKSSWGDDWQSRMKREYFVRLPDGNFARVVLDLMSHNGSLKVQAFTNPSGSRNLEYDPAAQR